MHVEKIRSKGSHKLNEDELLIKEHLFAVFDGAGSLVNFADERGRTGAKLAALIAKRAFAANNAPLDHLAREANRQIARAMDRHHIDMRRKESRWATCTAAVRVEKMRVNFFGIGDSMILGIQKNGSVKPLIPHYDQDLPTMRKWKVLAQQKIPDIRKRLNQQILNVRRDANVSYGVLNGEQAAERFFLKGAVSRQSLASVLLLTDGLFLPKENPDEGENWGKLAGLFQDGGLKNVLRYVRSVEKSDPNCWMYPRFRQHDDATAIAIDL